MIYLYRAVFLTIKKGGTMKARLINLMKILVESHDILTIKELTKKLEVSNKTVRNDLIVCEPYLKDLNVTLVKKSGVGIFIEADDETRLEALNKIKRQTVGLMGYGSLQRQLFIMKKLLLSKTRISFSWLEMNLYVSRPSIYKDINAVEKWLLERDIELSKDKYGRYILVSGEKRIRKAIFDWRSYCVKSLNQADLAEMIHDTYLGRKYEQERSTQIVRKIEEVFRIKFVPEDFKGMTTKMTIITERMYDGHYVTLKKETLKKLSQLSLFKDIDKISQYIKRNYHIHLTEAEKCYLLGLVVSLNIYQGAIDWNVDESCLKMIQGITNAIVDIIKKELFVLHDDHDQIYQRVISHVQTLVNQIHYGLYSFHTIADVVDSNYTTLCNIVETFSTIFKENLDYEMTVSDRSDWIIFLAELVEESKVPLNSVYIYGHKYDDAILVMSTLKNNFCQIVLTRAIPFDAYTEEDLSKYDIIFIDESYEDIRSSHPSVLVLPPLLSFTDKVTIFDRICRLYEEKNFNLIKK